MGVKLDLVNPPAHGQGASLDRHNAEARQGRWMMEMDRALFAAVPASAPGVRAAAALRTPASVPGQWVDGGAPADHPADQAASHSSKHDGLAERRRTPDFEEDEGCPQSASDRAMSASSQAQAVQSSGDSQPVSDAANADGAVGSANLAHGSGRHGHAHDTGVAETGARSLSAGSADGESDGVPAFAVAAHPHLFGSQGLAAQADGVQIAALAAGRAGAIGLGGMAVTSPQGELAEARQLEESEQSASGTQSEAEQYSEANLHLFEGKDGVQAWLRDARISEHQARLVAQSMARELAQQGNTLAALTVNGRRTLIEQGASQFEREAEALDMPVHDNPSEAVPEVKGVIQA
jgi:hypothetical protein